MKLSMMSASLWVWGMQPAAIAEASAKMGLDGIEWVTPCRTTAKELRKCSEDNGLPVVCFTFWANQAALTGSTEQVKNGIDFARELGAPRIMIPFCPLPDLTREESKALWRKNFQASAEVLHDSGIEWMIENYPGRESPMIYADDFFEYQKLYPEVKLVFDDGNSASCENELESLRRCRDFVRHVHFKDWKFFSEPPQEKYLLASRPDTVMSPRLIGEGDVHTREIWDELKRTGYSGYVSLEYEGRDQEPVTALTRVAKQLRAMA